MMQDLSRQIADGQAPAVLQDISGCFKEQVGAAGLSASEYKRWHDQAVDQAGLLKPRCLAFITRDIPPTKLRYRLPTKAGATSDKKNNSLRSHNQLIISSRGKGQIFALFHNT
jgi:hypothetical protein